jgi:hypothetical protein
MRYRALGRTGIKVSLYALGWPSRTAARQAAGSVTSVSTASA